MTTRRLQEVLATPIDGIISDQDSAWRDANPALTSGWEWTDSPTDGSAVVEELQRRLGVDVDGLMGPDTINALENHLGFEADGHLDAPSPTVAALQQSLNRGEF
jgi:prophage pi3 protein 05, muramidase